MLIRTRRITIRNLVHDVTVASPGAVVLKAVLTADAAAVLVEILLHPAVAEVEAVVTVRGNQ